jgi:gliding motility-associated-like protein
MKNIFSLIVVILISANIFSQPCTVTGTSPVDTVVCGNRVLLSAFGRAQGVALLSENFNGGTYGPGWASTQQAMWNNPCGPPVANGSTYVWMGNSSPVPRILTTTSFNLSSCVNAGVTICFDLKFARQGDSAPCEGPDEPNEGVYLQYSIDNGATWVNINYFDPNGGNDPQLINWRNWCFPVPAVALTGNTKFRWFQDADSGADYDHWGVDNVVIYCNDPSYNIVWLHDNYNLGPVGGTDPNPVSPRVTTNYVVRMSNGTLSCFDTVRIVVVNPTIVVDAGNDTTVCTGQCARLNAVAKIIEKPAKTPTYFNNEVTTIQTGFGAVSNIGINVTGLNMTNILPNSITQVCINNVFFFGTNIFPPGQITIRDLILKLTCPDGTVITLVPANVTTGGSNPFSGGYTNTCFVPTGANIATGTAPYSGSWAPNQPFNNLVGCSANGVWELNVQMNSSLGFGSGTFSGWSITFNDPEISYTGNYAWSPTTNMTNSNTLNPTVCPPPSAYTITVSDTANCVTASDVVNVNVQNCCNFTLQAAAVQPTCAQSNGSINITPTPAGNYSYNWGGGITTQNRTGLAAGSYTVTVRDITNNCTRDTTIVLNSNSSLAVSFSNQVNPTCAGNNGSITATLAGGTAPYQITIDTGGTPVILNSPIAGSQNLPNLHAGTVSVSVTDGQGCSASATATLVAPTNCCQFIMQPVITQPTCGQSNGSVVMNITNGSGNYTFNWSNGSTTNTANNLGTGVVNVTVTDNGQACTQDTSLNISSNSSLAVSFSNQVNPTCAGNDGSITVTLAGGTAPYQITIDTGGTPVVLNSPIAGSQNVPNLHAGTVSVSVTDGQGCSANATATLTAPTNCCQVTVSAVLVQPNCGVSDGSITLTAQNGSGSYTYLWSNTATTSAITSVGVGTYSVTITDIGFANCNIDTTFNLSNANAPVINGVTVVDASCPGVNNGSLTINASGGTGNYTYLWNTGGTINPLPNLTGATNYRFTVTDAVGCQAAGNATVGQGTGITVNLGNDTVICIGTPVSIDGTTPGAVTYAWSTAQFTPAITVNDSGLYVLTVTDAAGCTATDDKLVRFGGAFSVTILEPVTICPGGSSVMQIQNPTSNVSYLWSTGASGTSITVTDTGTYSVTATILNGCAATDDAIVTYAPPIDIDLGATIEAYEGQYITLNFTTTASTTGATYLWTPDTWLSCTTCPTPSAIATDDIIYRLQFTDNRGCEATDTVRVRVIGDFYVFMPNAFSPNGDGNNDLLFPYTNGVKLIEWKLFNRWGEKVFQSNSVTQGWDGTYRGKEAPMNNYVYTLTVVFLNDKTENYKGTVLLLR